MGNIWNRIKLFLWKWWYGEDAFEYMVELYVDIGTIFLTYDSRELLVMGRKKIREGVFVYIVKPIKK